MQKKNPKSLIRLAQRKKKSLLRGASVDQKQLFHHIGVKYHLSFSYFNFCVTQNNDIVCNSSSIQSYSWHRWLLWEMVVIPSFLSSFPTPITSQLDLCKESTFEGKLAAGAANLLFNNRQDAFGYELTSCNLLLILIKCIGEWLQSQGTVWKSACLFMK